MKGSLIANSCLLETVKVVNKVTSTLNLNDDKSFSFKDYIDQSGGFLQSAKKGDLVCNTQMEKKGHKEVSIFQILSSNRARLNNICSAKA